MENPNLSRFIPKSSEFIKDEKLKKPPLKNNDLFTKIKDPIPRKDKGSGSEPELEQ